MSVRIAARTTIAPERWPRSMARATLTWPPSIERASRSPRGSSVVPPRLHESGCCCLARWCNLGEGQPATFDLEAAEKVDVGDVNKWRPRPQDEKKLSVSDRADGRIDLADNPQLRGSDGLAAARSLVYECEEWATTKCVCTRADCGAQRTWQLAVRGTHLACDGLVIQCGRREHVINGASQADADGESHPFAVGSLQGQIQAFHRSGVLLVLRWGWQ
eukprot:6679411-Prymnesium_polylepis.1